MHGPWRIFVPLTPSNPAMPGRGTSGFHLTGKEGGGGGHNWGCWRETVHNGMRLLCSPVFIIRPVAAKSQNFTDLIEVTCLMKPSKAYSFHSRVDVHTSYSA